MVFNEECRRGDETEKKDKAKDDAEAGTNAGIFSQERSQKGVQSTCGGPCGPWLK
ncbi:MAG: hypothetical protein GX811_00890 [Lentisphaerae bacterium]|nr:hypothetical protein [Lentisphaerota bacterium]